MDKKETAKASKKYTTNVAAAERRSKARKEQQHPIETTETDPEWRKLPRSRPDVEEKYLAYQLLLAQGVGKMKAAEMLGYSPITAYSIDRRLKEKNQKIELLSERRIRASHRVLDKLLKGQTFGTIESVKDSTALRAAEVILDRTDPKGQQSGPVSFTIGQIDLSEIRYDYKPPSEPAGEDPAPSIPDLGTAPDEEPPEGTP